MWLHVPEARTFCTADADLVKLGESPADLRLSAEGGSLPANRYWRGSGLGSAATCHFPEKLVADLSLATRCVDGFRAPALALRQSGWTCLVCSGPDSPGGTWPVAAPAADVFSG
jgi:hypothetical protein